MADNITLTKITRNSGAYEANTTFETEQQPGGEHRPVVAIGSNGFVSTNNSTEALLGIGEVFTGVLDDITEYTTIIVSVYSDVASAAGGLSMQFRINGTWHESDVYSIAADTLKTFQIQAIGQYFRVVYTNGGTEQTDFCITTQYKKAGGPVSSHRLGDNVVSDDDAQLVQAVLKAQRPGGDFTNIDATNGGNLKVSIEEVESGVLLIATDPSVPVLYDSVYPGYTGSNMTSIVYKLAGDTVWTKTIGYDGNNNIISIEGAAP